MPRRHYIVTYDIADDKRRNQIFKLLQGEGDHVQYSVFFCECNPAELARLRGEINQIIHHNQDQVLLVDLGPANRPLHEGIEVYGQPYQPHIRTVVV